MRSEGVEEEKTKPLDLLTKIRKGTSFVVKCRKETGSKG